jgi:hypothetical protein
MVLVVIVHLRSVPANTLRGHHDAPAAAHAATALKPSLFTAPIRGFQDRLQFNSLTPRRNGKKRSAKVR